MAKEKAFGRLTIPMEFYSEMNTSNGVLKRKMYGKTPNGQMLYWLLLQ